VLYSVHRNTFPGISPSPNISHKTRIAYNLNP
jgi:hypothetical protein